MKVVLDTNIWISSLLLPQSLPGQIITAWQRAAFDVVISQPILDEIKKVLNYPKIKKRLAFPQEDIDEYLTFLRFFAEVVELPEKFNIASELEDNNDSHILTTLMVSNANYLITGDQDLLKLHKKFPIITARTFAEFLE